MTSPLPTVASVLDFWFAETDRKGWFRASDDLDEDVRRRFGGLLTAARRCELYAWRSTPQGRLAEILTLDQFGRHVFRNRAEAFSGDALALGLAQWAVDVGADVELSRDERAFLYMPYVHSESPQIQAEAIRLLSVPGLEASLRSAQTHKAVIDRFGRFPHRNACLGRVSTVEERDFLQGRRRGA